MTPPTSAIVVGAGITGCTIARTLAQAGLKVDVFDFQDRIGGLCSDHTDRYGFLVQDYGPHFFHTNDKEVWQFVAPYAAWDTYPHQVLARFEGNLYQFPINRRTLSQVGVSLANAEREVSPEGLNAQEYLMRKVGFKLTAMFFDGYSRKQWGVPLSQIPAWVVQRVAPRDDDNDDYFTDLYQGIPKAGFTHMMMLMLRHGNISFGSVVARCKPVDYRTFPKRDSQVLVYTGSLDKFFGFFDYANVSNIGTLPYRHTEFSFVNLPGSGVSLPATCVNECDSDTLYTRLTDNYRMYHPTTAHSLHPDSRTFTMERPDRTAPCNMYDDSTVACYPIPWDDVAKERHAAYMRLAQTFPHLYVAGRLADYKYYNMDQAVRRGLDVAKMILEGKPQC